MSANPTRHGNENRMAGVALSPAIAEAAFRLAAAARGLVLPGVLIVGRLDRCPVQGKPNRKDGAYVFFDDDIPAGGFENHTDGLGWANWHENSGRVLSPTELQGHRARIEAARRVHEEETEKRHARAAATAALVLDASGPALSDHPYLSRKRIEAAASLREIMAADAEQILGYAPRSDGERLQGRLLVATVFVGGELSTLEFIDEKGRKSAVKDGRKAGGFWTARPLPEGNNAEVTLLIGEGVATVLSAVEATGHHGVAALSCSNLAPVAEALRQRYPVATLVVLADIGAGEPSAAEAARRAGGVVAVPDFGDAVPDGATDFNDLSCASGAGAVRSAIEAVAALAVDEAPQPKRDKPTAIYPYCEGEFRVYDDGVWYHPPKNDNGGETQRPTRIASRIDVVAMTRNNRGEDWGRLLEWRDDDGRKHQWAMPVELLAGDGAEIRAELLRRGVQLGSGRGVREKLLAFLTAARPSARATCVERVGWFGTAFVLPNLVLGEDAGILCYQRTSAVESAFSSNGTVQEWRDGLCALTVGNARLVFPLSVAFAAPLLSLACEDGGGFHLRGPSSCGKSTALVAAASVYGAPREFVRTWRSTTNGLEALAALHNDGILLLDELGQMSPNEAGQAAYLLANGHGKTRASVAGTAKRSAKWRILFFSGGEQSLASLLAEAGKRTHAGQEIRLADIDADAGAGMGIIETLNGHQSAGHLVDAIRAASEKNYGAVGVEWLSRLVADRARIVQHLADNVRQVAADFSTAVMSGQARRVARRFAIAAVAGEMATAYGLTGWPEGHAIACARRCFESWLAGYGDGAGQKEDADILSHVRDFIGAHGNSRFQAWDTPDQRIIDRVGLWREVDGQRWFYVLSEAFKRELCAGQDPKHVAKVLREAGILEPGGDGQNQQKPRLPGFSGTTRCYVLSAAKLFEEAA